MDQPKVTNLIDYRPRVSSLNGQTAAVSPASVAPKRKLLDQVREAIRRRHYSNRTEKAYVHWVKRYIFFHNKRHPCEMAEPEIARFLSSLATEGARQRIDAEPGVERAVVSLS
jgi:hypothetical protein